MQNSKRSTFILLIAAVVMGVTGTQAVADDPVGVGNAGRVKPATSEVKTDFHLILKSDTNMTVNSAHISISGGPSVNPSTPPTGDGTNMVEFTWNGLGVDNTDTIRWSYLVTEEQRNNIAETAFFTPKASPTDVPALGWLVTNDGSVYLENLSASTIHFDDLLFQNQSMLTEAIVLSLLDSPPSGMAGLLTSGNVPAADAMGDPGSLFVGQFPLNPGDVLTSTMTTSFLDPSFSPITTYESLGHVHQIPEPTSWLLLLTGLLAYFSLGGYRRKAV